MNDSAQHTGAMRQATFAGGCFWCIEGIFAGLPGVASVTSGYTGGHDPNPTYERVSSGETGHAEAIRIAFDPEKITYPQLLEEFWRSIDPTDAGGQFVDRGSQYRTAIFYHTPEQKAQAEESRAALDRSGILPAPVVTTIEPAGEFYPAEEYHQQFARKCPLRYQQYHHGSGRIPRLAGLWDKAGQ